jgi:hypothetical protein
MMTTQGQTIAHAVFQDVSYVSGGPSISIIPQNLSK